MRTRSWRDSSHARTPLQRTSRVSLGRTGRTRGWPRIPAPAARRSFVFLPQLGEHGVVFQRGRVAHLFFAGGDVSQQAAHDFAAAGFGQGVGEADGVGRGEGADVLANVPLQFFLETVVAVALFERYEAGDAFALEFVGIA